MKERVKVFTYASGEGSTVLESGLEDHINEWLAKLDGELLFVTQSESHRQHTTQHTTVCVWYLSDESTRNS